MHQIKIRNVNSKPWVILGFVTIVCMLCQPIQGYADELSGLRQAIEQMEENLEAEKVQGKSEVKTKQKADDFKGFEFHAYSGAGFGWNRDGGTGNQFRWNYDASGGGDIAVGESAKFSIAALGFIDENEYETVFGGTTDVTDNGLVQNNAITKILYGGRAKYSKNKNIALQLEAGADYLEREPTTTADGHMEDSLYIQMEV